MKASLLNNGLPGEKIANAISLPAVREQADLAPLKQQAGFMDGTDGKGPRLTWARSYNTGYGMGWNAMTGTPYAITMGGRFAREAAVAAEIGWNLATSNPAIATIIDTLDTHAVFTGLTLSSHPDAEKLGITAEEARKLSNTIETRFAEWASTPAECDYIGRHDLSQLASAFFRSYLITGEGLATIDWKKFRNTETFTKVSVLAREQLDWSITRFENGMHILNGVCFSTEGRLVGYMLRALPLGSTNIHPMPTFQAATTAWGRTRVIHAFENKDVRAVRGCSPIIAALTPSNEKESLGEFTLANALLQTQFALTIESDLPPQAAFGSLSVNDEMSGMSGFIDDKASWYAKSKINPSPGTVNHLSPGDHLKFNKVENPGATFDSFDKSLSRKTARAAGSSYEDLSGDYSETSYSASRLATELPYRLTLKRRKAIVERFYKEVFAAWLEEQIERGLIEVPANAAPFWQAKKAYCAGKFLGIGRVSPDRKKEADAVVLELSNGLLTLTDALAERGIDFDQHLIKLTEERALLEKVGLSHPMFVGNVTTQNRNETIEDDDEDAAPAQTPKKGPRQ